MGKVGSTSIVNGLLKHEFEATKAHWLHHLYPEGEFPTVRPDIKERLHEPLNVIVPIREPMARNISAFFQKIDFYEFALDKTSVDKLYKTFLNKYRITYPDEWFRKELTYTFAVDPYGVPFNHSDGYQFYQDGVNTILIIRLEDCERVLPEAMEKLVGVPIQMKRDNASDAIKRRFGIEKYYRIFKNLKFPKHFVDKHYELEYAKHFYTEKEIQEFKKKWTS